MAVAAMILLEQTVLARLSVRDAFRLFAGLTGDSWRVSEWLAASLEMKCPVRGCGFESRALRLSGLRQAATIYAVSLTLLRLAAFFR